MSLDAAVGLLARLVAFDTISSRPNRPLIDFVAGCLRQSGVEARLVESPDGSKASLYATIGPPVAGGVVLSGHTDVVPVAGQAWRTDPFTLVAREGRLYGRGSADMKGFIAAVLAALPGFCRRRLRVPIHLAFSYDEEVGCLAAPELIKRLLAAVPRPALAIVGEPSEMKPANRHRGIALFETVVTGHAGHASSPEAGVNAISFAALCIAFLDGLNARFRKLSTADAEPGADAASVNVGTIAGGAAVNVIAGECRFGWECRPSPDMDTAEAVRALDAYVEAELLPQMRARAPESGIRSRQLLSVPPLVPQAGSPAEALALRLTGRNTLGSVPFASEAGQFQDAGIPAVIVGPGSAAQAHQPDEFVALDQIAACLAFLDRLGAWAETG